MKKALSELTDKAYILCRNTMRYQLPCGKLYVEYVFLIVIIIVIA